MQKFTGVDAYIKSAPKAAERGLRQVRATIKKAVPHVEEKISYGMLGFRAHGRYIAYCGGFKEHIGFYPPPPAVYKKEASKYAGPKGNLKFSFDKPLPLALITKIVKFRAKENLEKQKKS